MALQLTSQRHEKKGWEKISELAEALRERACHTYCYRRFKNAWFHQGNEDYSPEGFELHQEVGVIAEAGFAKNVHPFIYLKDYGLYVKIKRMTEEELRVWNFSNMEDVYEFLGRYKVQSINELRGKPILMYVCIDGKSIWGIDVPDSLILEPE